MLFGILSVLVVVYRLVRLGQMNGICGVDVYRGEFAVQDQLDALCATRLA